MTTFTNRSSARQEARRLTTSPPDRRVPTFARFERLVDGEPGHFAAGACDDCGGDDYDHERWCPRARGAQAGAEYVAASRRRAGL